MHFRSRLTNAHVKAINNRRAALAGRSFTCVLLLAAAGAASAQQATPDLSDISLEALADTQITSVTRKEEKLSETAAAAFVITQEDIRRSGATSLPEILRIVPGIQVARLDANKWAVTARGFNERYADKILMMIDGRTVLDPLSSGVNWDAQDLVLEDIERIEVIRGPGASVWGANAVNGVINVITKASKDTQGLLLVERAGDQEHESGTIRFGGTMGDRGAFRVFAKYLNRGPFTDAAGHAAPDDGNSLHGGFRTDWRLNPSTGLSVQGDIYSGQENQAVTGLTTLNPPPGQGFLSTFLDQTRIGGGDVLAEWHHSSSDRLDTTAQMYADRADRNQPGVLGEYRHAVDVELEQHLRLGRNDMVWGGDYRLTADRTVGSLNISFDPAARTTNLFGVFLQDEITLVPDKLRITLGSKLEHNAYSGFALQPTFRTLWMPGRRNTLWLAISEAAENSSRMDANVRTNDDAFVDGNGRTTLVSSFGTDPLPADDALAFELGHRAQLKKWLSVDVATFYNRYWNRHTHEPGDPYVESTPEPVHVVVPNRTASLISGETHGLELSTTVKKPLWRLTTGYTFFEIHLHASPLSQDFETAPGAEGSTPRHQVQATLQLNLPHRFEFDNTVYHVGRLPSLGVAAYTRLDSRIGWHPRDTFDLSFGLQNILDPRHFEFASGDLATATQVGREIYGKISWRL